MHFRCRSVGTQRKHTACHVSFIFCAHYACIQCLECYSNVHPAMHFRCRSVDTQRKHTTCHVSFIFGAHRMQAYSALSAIVMCILRCTSVAAPLVLNANTLRVTFLLYLAHAYASIQCVECYSNVHLAMHFHCRSVDTQRKHTACHVSFIFGARLYKHTVRQI